MVVGDGFLAMQRGGDSRCLHGSTEEKRRKKGTSWRKAVSSTNKLCSEQSKAGDRGWRPV